MAIVVIGDTKTWHSPLIVGALLANEQHVVTFFLSIKSHGSPSKQTDRAAP
jgi:hypothetical protein